MNQATAASNNVQFNIWGRGGNDGHLFSANYFWNETSIYAYVNGNWPFAVSANEMCKDANDPNITSQWDLYVWNLASVGLQGAWGATATNPSNDDNGGRCRSFGNAAFGTGDTTWASPNEETYATQGAHNRELICVNPRIGLFNFSWRSCSTHLENDDDPIAANQLDVVNTRIYNWASSGKPTIWGGDFNLSPQRNGNPPWIYHLGLMGPTRFTLSYWMGLPGSNHFEAGGTFATYENRSLPLAEYQKLDYSGYSSPTFHKTMDPNTSWAGYISCSCGANGNRVSDHAMLRVFVST
ncbi:MAG: hypothetical protein WCI50_04155 [Actinomycetes bacterium]